MEFNFPSTDHSRIPAAAAAAPTQQRPGRPGKTKQFSFYRSDRRVLHSVENATEEKILF